MTTETTDPVETVMEAADDYAVIGMAEDASPEFRKRLRLHVQLALAKARVRGVMEAAFVPRFRSDQVAEQQREIAALEARVQED